MFNMRLPEHYQQVLDQAHLDVKRRETHWLLHAFTPCGQPLAYKKLEPRTPDALRCASIAFADKVGAAVMMAVLHLERDAACLLLKERFKGKRTALVFLSDRALGTKATFLLPNLGVWVDAKDCALADMPWMVRREVKKEDEVTYQ